MFAVAKRGDGCLLVAVIVFALLVILGVLGSTDTAQWRTAKRENSVKSYKSYLDRNPNGSHKSEALAGLKEAVAKETSFFRIMREDPESSRAWRMIQDDERSKALIENRSDKYVLIGVRAVNKEVGTIFKREMLPALFIYVLQGRADPRKLLVSVSQSHGYSIGEVLIGGSAFDSQTRIAGAGIYWGGSISPSFTVPDKTYEKEVLASNLTNGVVGLTVSYSWFEIVGGNNFINSSATTGGVFPLRSNPAPTP